MILQEDKTLLDQNLARKEILIETLRSMPETDPSEQERAILSRITQFENENIELARSEMERLRVLLKKAQEGLTTVRGYDAFSTNVGATYIDQKR